MTKNEAAILEALTFAWQTPRQFGGSDGSHHAITARRMIDKGWVERDERGWLDGKRPMGSRGPYVYRLTDKGAQALANHTHLRTLPV